MKRISYLALCFFAISLFVYLYPSIFLAFVFNRSSLEYLKGHESTAIELVLPYMNEQSSLPAVNYYHLFQLKKDDSWIFKAFHKNPSSFAYLTVYMDKAKNKDIPLGEKHPLYAVPWNRYLLQKSLELANHRNEDIAVKGLLLLAMAQKTSPKVSSLEFASTLAFRHQSYHKAQILFDDALSKDVKNVQVYRNLARFYQRTKKWSYALSFYENTRRMEPNHYSTYIEISRIHVAEKNYLQALHYLNYAQKIDPNQESAYYEIARIYLTMGEHSLAFDQYRALASFRPGSHQARYQWGLVLFQHNQFESALIHFTMAIALKPDYALNYYYRAQSYFQLKKPHFALSEIEKAIALSPDQDTFQRFFEQIVKSMET